LRIAIATRSPDDTPQRCTSTWPMRPAAAQACAKLSRSSPYTRKGSSLAVL
jgi:hypothetical protein